MIVTLMHLKSVPVPNNRPGYCNRGARPFFKRHGLDWGEFRRVGLPEEVILKTGDAMAIRLVQHARGEL